MSDSTKLLLRKALVAFLVAFVGGFATALTNLSDQPVTTAVVIGVLSGALGAGARAALAVLPVNLVPSDAQHTVVGKKEGVDAG